MERQRSDATIEFEMRLRGYNAGDLARIYALDVVCFEPPFRFSERAMRQFAEAHNALTVVAEDESTEHVGGFCIAHVEPARKGLVAYVVTLDVAPGFRRQGLARRMLRRIEEQAMEADCDAMALHVSIENEPAITFYESEGYERTHTVRSFYGSGRHAYVYRKTLGGPSVGPDTLTSVSKA